jgi:lysophospholipid acyltransferase (LPLAT)-like uncharacterized protein
VAIKVNKLSFWKRIGVRVLAMGYRLAIRTIRIRMTDRTRAFLAEQPRGALFLFWHNRLLLAVAGFWKYGKSIPLTVLTSASKDGAIVEVAVEVFGIETVRGSSSRRAFEATRELFAAMGEGRNLVITPDGPRGPIYTVKMGTAQIATSHAPAIYLFGFNVDRCWQLKSWDRFIIPKPFAVIDVDIEKLEPGVAWDQEQLRVKMAALTRDVL